jgi:hypothetical protein
MLNRTAQTRPDPTRRRGHRGQPKSAIIPASTAGYYTRPDVTHLPVEDIEPNQVCLAWIASRRSRLIYEFADIASDVGALG